MALRNVIALATNIGEAADGFVVPMTMYTTCPIG
jgi:hypothetical protein